MPLAPQHLGGLHPLEGVLVLVLAFGPLVAVVVTVFYLRRRDDRAAESPRDPVDEPRRPSPR